MQSEVLSIPIWQLIYHIGMKEVFFIKNVERYLMQVGAIIQYDGVLEAAVVSEIS